MNKRGQKVKKLSCSKAKIQVPNKIFPVARLVASTLPHACLGEGMGISCHSCQKQDLHCGSPSNQGSTDWPLVYFTGARKHYLYRDLFQFILEPPD